MLNPKRNLPHDTREYSLRHAVVVSQFCDLTNASRLTANAAASAQCLSADVCSATLPQADDPALSYWPEERLRIVKRSEEDEDKAETRQQQVCICAVAGAVLLYNAQIALLSGDAPTSADNACFPWFACDGVTACIASWRVLILSNAAAAVPSWRQPLSPNGVGAALSIDPGAVQRIWRHRQRLVEERQAKEAKAAGRPWAPPGAAGQKAQQPAHHGVGRL